MSLSLSLSRVSLLFRCCFVCLFVRLLGLFGGLSSLCLRGGRVGE